MRPINKEPTLDDIIDVIRKIDIKYDGKSGAVSQAISDLNYKVVQPAIKEANQTAKQADKLVEQSKVHDDAIKAQDEALTEAKQNINEAWSTAHSALEEVKETGKIQAADHRDLVANQQALDQLTTALASQSAETVVVKQTASEASVTAKGANEAAVQAKVTAASAQTIATNAASDVIVATQTAQEAKTVATNAQGAVSVLDQTVNGFSQRVSEVENSVKTQVLSDSQQDLNRLTTTGIYSIHRTDTANAPSTEWCLVTVRNDNSGRMYQTWQSDSNPESRYYRTYNGSWSSWAKVTNQSDISSLNNKVTSAQTAIDQNKASIQLKADKTTVDALNNTVVQQQATLKTASDAISSKVWKSDITSATNGLASQSFVQTTVNQKADLLSLTINKLQDQVDRTKIGGVNLISNSDGTLILGYGISNTTWQDGKAYHQLPTTVNADEVLPQSGSVSSFTSYYGWQANTTYCQSIMIDTDASLLTATPQMSWFNTKKHIVVNGKLEKIGNNTYRLWTTYTPSQDDVAGGKLRLLDLTNLTKIINMATGTYIKLYHPQLERGSQPTDWSPAPSDLATSQSVTNLTASVDGLQGVVRDKASQAQFNELSNLIQTKVANETFSSKVSQLAEAINLRVATKDLISQINLQAGGNGLIQINNGRGKLVMDAGTTVFTGIAFIPGAAISELSADKITSGTIATGALKVNLNQGLIDFRTGNGSGTYFTKDQVVFSKNNVEPGFIGIAGSPISNTTTNELSINYHGKNKGGFAVRDIDNLDRQGRLIVSNEDNRWEVHTNNATYAKLVVGNKDPYFEYHYGTGLQTDVINGLYLDSSGSSLKYKPVHQETGTGIHVSDALISIHGDNTISATGCQLRVQGWSWVAGYVEAMGHSLHSALSLKTNIEPLDTARSLALINQTDLTSFTFKSEIATGSNFRHFGPIIDDVNQVAQYNTPPEFIAATYGDAPARDDDNIIGALMGAVQELTKRLEKVEKTNGI